MFEHAFCVANQIKRLETTHAVANDGRIVDINRRSKFLRDAQ